MPHIATPGFIPAHRHSGPIQATSESTVGCLVILAADQLGPPIWVTLYFLPRRSPACAQSLDAAMADDANNDFSAVLQYISRVITGLSGYK